MPNKKITKEDRQLINELFWASFPLEASYNYEGQQAIGFAVGMWPAIKRFYKTKEEQADALQRHLALYNTTPQVSSIISGIAAAMEKEASTNPEFDKNSINSVKVGLMGPFAGIGDSFFWGTFRVIATGIGVSLAQEANAMAPIAFLLIYNILHILVRYYGCQFGYTFGTEMMSGIASSDTIKKLSKAATIVGLIVIGGMAASMVSFTTSVTFTFNETEFALQDYINQIAPLLLPFLYTIFMYRLLKRGWKSSYILLLTLAIGIVGACIGFF